MNSKKIKTELKKKRRHMTFKKKIQFTYFYLRCDIISTDITVLSLFSISNNCIDKHILCDWRKSINVYLKTGFKVYIRLFNGMCARFKAARHSLYGK